MPLFLDQEQAGDAFRHEMHIPTQIGPLLESRFDRFEWPDALVQRVAGAVQNVLFDVVGRTNGYSAEKMAERTFRRLDYP